MITVHARTHQGEPGAVVELVEPVRGGFGSPSEKVIARLSQDEARKLRDDLDGVLR